MTGFPAQPARDALTALAIERDLTSTDLARNLGVDRSTLYRLFNRDTLRYDAADHIAVALGRHPSELWPEWFAQPRRHQHNDATISGGAATGTSRDRPRDPWCGGPQGEAA